MDQQKKSEDYDRIVTALKKTKTLKQELEEVKSTVNFHSLAISRIVKMLDSILQDMGMSQNTNYAVRQLELFPESDRITPRKRR